MATESVIFRFSAQKNMIETCTINLSGNYA